MKAILVVDMPESCLSCPLTLANLCKCKELTVGDLINGNGEYVEGTLRHISCPLRPLPQIKYINSDDTHDDLIFEMGWNGCLDEILGEKE